MSRLKTISDKLDYIAMGKLNKEQMEYICEIDQEVNLKDREIERLNNIIKEVREKINNFDVFKEFTFPLMKREEENQVKSSIDYEWNKTIKEPLLKILGEDKE